YLRSPEFDRQLAVRNAIVALTKTHGSYFAIPADELRAAMNTLQGDDPFAKVLEQLAILLERVAEKEEETGSSILSFDVGDLSAEAGVNDTPDALEQLLGFASIFADFLDSIGSTQILDENGLQRIDANGNPITIDTATMQLLGSLGLVGNTAIRFTIAIIDGQEGVEKFDRMVAAGDGAVREYAGDIIQQYATANGLTQEQVGDLTRIAGAGITAAMVLSGKRKDTGLPNVPGRVQSRVNLRNGDASSGWVHTMNRHFGGNNTQSQFTLSQTEVRGVLQSDLVVSAPVTDVLMVNGAPTYVRRVDVGQPIGTVRQSHGGGSTSNLYVQTDGAGNLITAYPIP
ncbi:MAG: hypothetical protein GY943_24630, partial [Chloroflexi bacterium]|nr:hypothetical protein [Chloroflexota bacterium]